ncbi:cation:proton antiporter domain-containing protein [Nocardioides sp. T2.26MG-1]|uniref:cation:proton antiporter domain-containing protein n=1 Tax=Nocardioides sp. T2.26MG-1 TaxID=3041166 RepID=UPI002477C7EE|nr:cation:proton antiporter [Nocardioides sp. T2.26MG-1]CAI9400006.1 Sodium, potassium, lithium and rubidium/H(+) antiporter [Nocardioides sp. T2.26MG-1]
MDIALFLVALAVGVLAGVVVAGRMGIPAPLLLVVAGVAASFLPFVPQVHLEPDVVLFGLLPPLLYSTAITSSLVDFNANRRAILLLSVGLVVFTTLGVGWLVHALVPGLSWPIAFALGAVVAPPDAVAATSIGRHIGLPRRVVTILEGESLFNDATALVSLQTALAATGVGVEMWRVGYDFVVAAGGGILLGLLAYLIVAALRRRTTDPVLDVGMSFVIPFAAFLAAEEIHASGVVAVVTAGLLLGHKAPILQTAQSRIAERINWRTIAFLLENTVFALIGLQAQWLFQDLGDSSLSVARIASVSVATLVAVIVLRVVWVFVARYVLVRPRADPVTGQVPPWSFTLLLGWAGMRGVVTLAAAFLIPGTTEHREVLLVIAFTVVAGTLLIQGLTLPWMTRRLRVPAPDPLDDALARATLLQQASKAAVEELERIEYDDQTGVCDLIRQRLDQRNFAAWERLGTTADEESPAALYYRVRMAMIDAERRRILEIRRSGTIASEVIAEVLAMLDVEESMLDRAEQDRDEAQHYARRRWTTGDTCDDLARFPVVDAEPATSCQACLDEGTRWVALRRCLECGNVACCDSSPRQHATRHFHDSQHPVMQSAEPGEDWRWCYVHHLTA